MIGFVPDQLKSLRNELPWPDASQKAARLWLGRHSAIAAWLGLILAIFSPPHGVGFTVCWLKAATNLPCPGCGLMRSFSCGIRGRFLESLQYHPLGLIILTLFFFTALLSLCPCTWREKAQRRLECHGRLATQVYWSFIIIFIGFGVIRAFRTFFDLTGV